MAGICPPILGSIPGSVAPAGPAGGDLGGAYPDPRVALVGDVSIVTTYAQFVASPSISTAGPVHTVIGIVQGSGLTVFPAGEKVVYSETGFLVSVGFDVWTLEFDVDDNAIRGPVVAYGVQCRNVNAGASAWAWLLESSLGRTLIFSNSSGEGIRGVRVENVLGAVSMLVAAAGVEGGSEIGFSFGGVIGAVGDTRSSTLVVSSVGVEIDATTVIASGLIVQSGASTLSLTQPGQHAFSISDSVVLAPGAVLTFAGCTNTGSQDAMFRQDVGDMSVDDLRIVSKGNPSAADWTALMDAGRLDLSSALSVVLPVAPSAPVPIPFSTGAGLEVEDFDSIRFRLVKIAGAPFGWFEEYLGTIPGARASVSWSTLFERSGGGQSDITICSETNRALVVTSCQQDDGAVFTDFTSEAQSATIDDVPLVTAAPVIGDAIYFATSPTLPAGLPVGPETIKIVLSQSGVGAYTLAWEYFNGVSYVALVGLVDGTSSFKNAPATYDVTHTRQGDMSTDTVNGVLGFYIRARVTAGGLSVQPLATQVFTYTGFAVIPTTVTGAESRAIKQNASKTGDVLVNPGDRFRPAIQNQGAAHTVLVYDITQNVRVFP